MTQYTQETAIIFLLAKKVSEERGDWLAELLLNPFRFPVRDGSVQSALQLSRHEPPKYILNFDFSKQNGDYRLGRKSTLNVTWTYIVGSDSMTAAHQELIACYACVMDGFGYEAPPQAYLKGVIAMSINRVYALNCFE